MGYENILYEKKDGIAYITFNRPKVLNALNRKTVEELQYALLDARNDQAVRVLILTGAGEKAFVAGAALNELELPTALQLEQISVVRQRLLPLLGTTGQASNSPLHCVLLGAGLDDER